MNSGNRSSTDHDMFEVWEYCNAKRVPLKSAGIAQGQTDRGLVRSFFSARVFVFSFPDSEETANTKTKVFFQKNLVERDKSLSRIR